MLPAMGTRFPESPIPSRVLIAIGPGAPPRGQLHWRPAQGLVEWGIARVPCEASALTQAPAFGLGCPKAPPSAGGVPARRARIVKCAQAHPSAGRGAIRVAS